MKHDSSRASKIKFRISSFLAILSRLLGFSHSPDAAYSSLCSDIRIHVKSVIFIKKAGSKSSSAIYMVLL